MLGALATFAGVFVGVIVILLVAVGQLGKVDTQTLVVILVCAGASGAVAAARRLRGPGREPDVRER
jgi:hypothetical protein